MMAEDIKRSKEAYILYGVTLVVGIYIHPELDRICPYLGWTMLDFVLQGILMENNLQSRQLALSIDPVETVIRSFSSFLGSTSEAGILIVI